MPSGMEHRPVDRAAMIEAASRQLRQQMGRTRDQPRSRGSFSDAHTSSANQFTGETRSDPRASRDPHNPHADSRGGENAQRRIRSAENEHRILRAQQQLVLQRDMQRDAMAVPAQPSSALDHYPAEEEPPHAEDTPHFDDPPQELRRPLSRKKDPSASAALGLGAASNPVKMMDAFEQRKTRQPIPVESWGPRPPSRQGGLPAKTSGLDGSLLDEGRSAPHQYPASTSSRSGTGMGGASSTRSGSGMGGTWASARYTPMHDTRPGRERKSKDRGARDSRTDVPGSEDLGIFGCSTNSTIRSPTNQQLAKALSGVFDHGIPLRAGRPETREGNSRADSYTPSTFGQSPVARPDTREAAARPEAFSSNTFAQGAGSWASHVDPGPAALDLSFHGLGEGAAPWPSSPAGSCAGGSPPTRQTGRGQAARHSELVSVEDVEPEPDLGLHASSFRRDATPPRLVVTRSSQQNKSRGDVRRGRDERTRERGSNMPFSTGLDPDFLGLFAA